MIVAIGFDHAGFPLRDAVITAIEKAGHEVLDFGTRTPDPVDYPDYASLVGEAIISGKAERGVLVCGSGVGICIAANKIKGIYAAICHDAYSAHQGVEHDGMNVLCLGGRIIGTDLAKELVRSFLSAEYSGEERHNRRTGKVKSIENREMV